jgi:hypothetical protein
VGRALRAVTTIKLGSRFGAPMPVRLAVDACVHVSDQAGADRAHEILAGGDGSARALGGGAREQRASRMDSGRSWRRWARGGC